MAYGDFITTVGKNKTAQLVAGTASLPFKYIAIGIGTTTPTASDTQLESEITTYGGQRVLGTVTVTGNQFSLANTFTFTNTFAVTECGSLDAATVGNLYCHSVFAAKNVVDGEQLQVTINITYTA